MKCQALQRRLVLQTEASAAREAQIHEQERLYAELKGILARQPGPEAANRVSELQVRGCLVGCACKSQACHACVLG